MAKTQKWSTEINGELHTVEYTPKTLFSKAKITIDDKTYPLLSAKLFGISQEVFLLGGERAIISIGDDKKATITVDNEPINEI